jgi:hypothetical protein
MTAIEDQRISLTPKGEQFARQRALGKRHQRIDRRTDKRLRTLNVHSDRLRELYELRIDTGLHLTVLIDLAISNLYNQYQEHGTIDNEPD